MKNYFIKTFNGMVMGLFASLIIGLIIKQFGDYTGIIQISNFGKMAQLMMGPAIGGGVAYSLNASPLVIFGSMVTGAIGAGSISLDPSGQAILKIGEPVGAYIAGLAGAEVGRRLSGKTKIDIVISPGITILAGGFAGILLGPIVSKFISLIGSMINSATMMQPLFMGIIISVVMGLVLTMPMSSAALSIALGLDGLAAGAALIGCCCQMVGFAVASYEENKMEGLLAQGLGTAKLQLPNIINNPKILIPTVVSSAILGPVGTMIFSMKTNSIGAGMGSSGLVGQIATFAVMGKEGLLGILLLHFVLPGIISYVVAKYLKKIGWIGVNDMKLPNH